VPIDGFHVASPSFSSYTARMLNTNRFRLFSALSVVIAAAALGCAGEIAPSEDPTGTATQAATAYNTPEPTYNDAGLVGSTRDNPFALIVTQKFADASHKDFWAVDPNGVYGTFHQGLLLSGVWQYKWIACGTTGAGC
jgi:hypothetical protein